MGGKVGKCNTMMLQEIHTEVDGLVDVRDSFEFNRRFTSPFQLPVANKVRICHDFLVSQLSVLTPRTDGALPASVRLRMNRRKSL